MRGSSDDLQQALGKRDGEGLAPMSQIHERY